MYSALDEELASSGAKLDGFVGFGLKDGGLYNFFEGVHGIYIAHLKFN